MSKSSEPLRATIDRFEDGFAVLELEHDQSFSVAKRYLPADIKEGDVLQVDLLTDKQATKRQENLARAMLEEILNGK